MDYINTYISILIFSFLEFTYVTDDSILYSILHILYSEFWKWNGMYEFYSAASFYTLCTVNFLD